MAGAHIIQLNVISDHILSAASDGRVIFNTITTFLKKQPMKYNDYLSIMTSRNHSISLIGNHLIYSRKHQADKFNPV